MQSKSVHFIQLFSYLLPFTIVIISYILGSLAAAGRATLPCCTAVLFCTTVPCCNAPQGSHRTVIVVDCTTVRRISSLANALITFTPPVKIAKLVKFVSN